MSFRWYSGVLSGVFISIFGSALNSESTYPSNNLQLDSLSKPIFKRARVVKISC